MSTNNRFVQLPNALFEGALAELSSDGKLLFSLLLSRRSLSRKNNLTDAQGKTIVYYTNQEVCEKLKCGHDKATKLFRELERYHLISRRKQGLGKPDLIYVKEIPYCEKAVTLYAEDQKRNMRNNSFSDGGNPARNRIDKSYTNSIILDPSFNYDEIEEKIKDLIEYDVLSARNYGEVLDEIVSLISDTYCTEERYVRVAKRQILTQTFRARVSKLTAEHIEYAIKSLEKNKGRIKNVRAYLLTTLYYAIDSLEIDSIFGN